MRLSIALLTLVLMVTGALAEETKTRKEINFEGEVVEGVGRQSLDSLSSLSDQDGGDEMRLYEKHENYDDKDIERIFEMIETY